MILGVLTMPRVASTLTLSSDYSLCEMAKRSTARSLKKLSGRHEAFVEAYVRNGERDGAGAYREAYGDHLTQASAQQLASRLLSEPVIQEYLGKLKELKRKRQEQAAKARGIDADSIIAEQARAGFFDIRELFTADGKAKMPHELSENAARVVTSVKLRVSQSRDKAGEKGESAQVAGVLEYKLADKLKALRDMGDGIGMYKRVHEHIHRTDDLRDASTADLLRRVDELRESLSAAGEIDQQRTH